LPLIGIDDGRGGAADGKCAATPTLPIDDCGDEELDDVSVGESCAGGTYTLR
jgi:hypothetical protein